MHKLKVQWKIMCSCANKDMKMILFSKPVIFMLISQVREKNYSLVTKE